MDPSKRFSVIYDIHNLVVNICDFLITDICLAVFKDLNIT